MQLASSHSTWMKIEPRPALHGILDREASLLCRIEQFEDEVSVC